MKTVGKAAMMPEGSKIEAEGPCRAEQRASSPAAWGPGERCELSSRVWGGVPTAQMFYTIFSGLSSPDIIILLIVGQKKKYSYPTQSPVNYCAFADAV